MAGGSNASHKTGDLCWDSENASVLLGGKSTRLIKDTATGVWRLKDDDGSRVQHLTGAPNGDNDGEYWLITTTDGTRYYFGKTSRYTADTGDTSSTWTVPVNGNQPGEPCYSATFASGFCAQAWRWNLDYIVDLHGNTITNNYTTETNRYGQNLNTKSVAYDRGGYLSRIDYGQVAGTETAANVQQQVVFATGERCIPSGAVTCDPAQLTAANQGWWPDVPFDQICTSATACELDQVAPTFFSRRKLSTVSTSVRVGGTLTAVDRWTLAGSFPAPGDGSSAGLWLDSITRKGMAGAGINLPPVLFGKTTQMPNRVDSLDYAPPLMKYRVATIRTETGANIGVSYSGVECVAGSVMPSAPDSNTRRCFPSYWTPLGFTDPVLNYFHKYLVTQVSEDGAVATSLTKLTRYDYSASTPAWHYDDATTQPAKYRTWSGFRGYSKVSVLVGDTAEARPLKTTSTFFRGMNGDKTSTGTRTGITVPDSAGGTVTDSEQWNGVTRESITYNGAAVVSGVITTPWSSTARASDGFGSAYLTGTAATSARTTIAGSATPRVVASSSTFTADGFPLVETDSGDTAITGDERCTRSTYTANAGLNLLGLPSRVQTVSVPCTATPNPATDTISDVRTYYDGHGALSDDPTRGDATKTDQFVNTGPGTTGYATMSTTSYDGLGRVLTSADALGRATGTVFTPADNQPTTGTTVTNPAGQVASVTFDPGFGAPLTATDENARVTRTTLDALGRKTGIWLANRPSTLSASYTFGYQVTASSPVAVTTSSLHYNGGPRIVSTALYDGLLRPLQTQGPVNGGGRVLSDSIYDSRGLAVAARGPWFNNASGPSTGYVTAQDNVIDTQVYTVFDGAGRATKATTAVFGVAHNATSTVFNGDSTDTLPPAGGTATRSVVDARGRASALWSYQGATVTAAKDVTSYTVNNKDQLTRLVNAEGSTWSWAYDLAGNKVSATDPDKGASAATFDLAGQQTSATDARGKKVVDTYDTLGRKTVQQDGAGATLASWTYDTVVGGKGQLASSSSFVAASEYKTAVNTYDALYHPTQTTTTIPATETGLAGTYVHKSFWTVDGSQSSTTMPAVPGLPAETWSVGRDSINQGLNLSASDSLVSGSTRNAFGELTQYVQAAVTGKGVYVSNTYETGLHRVKTQRIDRDNIATADAFTTYGRDLAGNITSLADVPQVAVPARTDRQCFQYDTQRRLTQAWSNGATVCAATPALVATGAKPYWSSWTYSKSGNRLSEVRHGATTAANTTITSTYPLPTASAPTPPHAPSVVTTKVGAAAATTAGLTYDASGNTLTTPLNGAAATLTWDTPGHLSTLTTPAGAASNVYDGGGNLLVKKTVAGAKTLFLGETEVTHTPAKGPVPASTTSRRIYTFDGQAVATRTATGAAGLWYTPPNIQGTAALQINASTAAISKRYFTPFGAPRGTAPAWQSAHGFLGGTGATTDPTTGLTHLGARDYNPALGRFLSVDPLMDTGDPQQLNGYNYANNTPITTSDPTGLFACDRCDGSESAPAGYTISGGGGSNPPRTNRPRLHSVAATPTGRHSTPAHRNFYDPPDPFRPKSRSPIYGGPEWEAQVVVSFGLVITAGAVFGCNAFILHCIAAGGTVAKVVDESGGSAPVRGATAAKAGSKLLPKVNNAFQFPGAGRSGAGVKNFVGPPNTIARGASPGRVFVTDEQGRVIFDVTRDRVKPVVPGQGFVSGDGRKLTPTSAQLSWIDELWGG
jgi:RHS repeat-associated protein